MSFNDLRVNGEKIPEGERVRIVQGPPAPTVSWWDRPATLDTYILTAGIILSGVALGIIVGGA